MIENYVVDGQMSFSDLGIWFGKTSPEACQVPEKDTPVKTSKRSSQKSSGSSAKTRPMFLFLMAGGPTADASAEWVTLDYPFPFVGTSTTLNGGAYRKDAAGLHWWQISTDLLPVELCLTLNCGEKPMEPNPTRLSQVLEEMVDKKYNLSAKACAGILLRAEKRGRQLPEQLEKALRSTISNDDIDRQNNSCQLSLYEQHSQDSRYNPLGEVGETVSAKYGTGGNNTPIVIGRRS